MRDNIATMRERVEQTEQDCKSEDMFSLKSTPRHFTAGTTSIFDVPRKSAKSKFTFLFLALKEIAFVFDVFIVSELFKHQVCSFASTLFALV